MLGVAAVVGASKFGHFILAVASVE
jgi:hypothetical protein